MRTSSWVGSAELNGNWGFLKVWLASLVLTQTLPPKILLQLLVLASLTRWKHGKDVSQLPLFLLMQDVTTVCSRSFLEAMSHPGIYCGGWVGFQVFH